MDVAGPAITSTSAISGTGLKKCMPTTRSGRRVTDPIAATDSELVFVARIAPSAAVASSRRKASRLSARSSGMASTTRSAAESASRLSAGRMRASASVASFASSWPFPTFRSRKPPMRSRARSVAPSSGSWTRTPRPASAATWTIPAPIVPAPRTPTVWISVTGR